jgi:hypothetical protein
VRSNQALFGNLPFENLPPETSFLPTKAQIQEEIETGAMPAGQSERNVPAYLTDFAFT